MEACYINGYLMNNIHHFNPQNLSPAKLILKKLVYVFQLVFQFLNLLMLFQDVF